MEDLNNNRTLGFFWKWASTTAEDLTLERTQKTIFYPKLVANTVSKELHELANNRVLT